MTARDIAGTMVSLERIMWDKASEKYGALIKANEALSIAVSASDTPDDLSMFAHDVSVCAAKLARALNKVAAVQAAIGQ